MIEKADPNLVVEHAVWPAYLPDKKPRRPPSPTDPWLEDISAEEKELVTVLLPPPPSVSGLATLFLDNPEANERSRQALTRYRAEYKELDNWPYPLRLSKANHTNLPAFLNGYLDEVFTNPEESEQVAGDWLFEGVRAEALFGDSAQEVQKVLKPWRVVQVRKGRDQTGLLLHVRYQHWHQEWPVFSSGVIVHLSTGDRRASTSSSYFPLNADLSLSQEIDAVQAIVQAQVALAGYLDGPQAIGLYWYILRHWLEEPGVKEPPGLSWGTIEARIAEKQIYALATFSQIHDHVFPEIEQVVKYGDLPDTQEELLNLLLPAWQMWPQFSTGAWQVEVAPFFERYFFIFPFAGQYHLACQVEFLSPNADEGWRVFVNVQNGEVLGRPESLVAHSLDHFSTAEDLIDGSGPTTVPLTALELETAIDNFMTFRFHLDQGGDEVDLATISDKSEDTTTRFDREAANIAFHANKMYRYFIDNCGADPVTFGSSLDHGLEVAVGQLGPLLSNGTRALIMRFNNASVLQPKLITFQTDNGSGLTFEGGKIVFHPSFDPGVVYHEFGHGFMWQQNNDPFDDQNSSVPFGRALVEGLANLFAHLLAEHLDGSSFLWARASYRQGIWEDDWSLSRDKKIPGEDLLPAPNLYPHNITEGLPVYHVGMIPARAIWDIRDLLGSDLADQLAFRAYGFVLGWVANFEMLAEGLINEARLDSGVTPGEVETIIDIFAQRRILAERGIQALALTDGGELFVGTDDGLRLLSDDGTTWIQLLLGGAGATQDVVALATEGDDLYVATEDAVYNRDSTGAWLNAGTWPAEHRPFSMLVVDSVPYVGTGHGVLRLIGGNWQQWEQDQNNRLDGLALQMADMVFTPNSSTAEIRNRYVAMVKGIQFHEHDAPGKGWENSIGLTEGINEALITAIAARGDTVYVGTLNNGISYQNQIGFEFGFTILSDWQIFVNPENIAGSAVLCLAVDNGNLWAGTTAGLYQIQLNFPNNGPLFPVEEGSFPADATVTTILSAAGSLFVGTATGEVWRKQGANPLSIMPDVGL